MGRPKKIVTTPPPPPNPVGRPRKEINKEEFEKLCGLHCTEEDIAGWFDCSVDTIDNWCKREYLLNFSDVYKRKCSPGKVSIRRKQMEVAQNGNPTMLIWLGKTILGQRDNVEHIIIRPGTDDAIKQELSNMYGRIELMAQELKMKHIPQQPEQGLLVESCQTPQVQS